MQISSNSLFRLNRQNIVLLLLTLSLYACPAFARQEETKPEPRDIVPVFETVRPPNPKLPDKNNPAKKPKHPSSQHISARQNSGRINRTNRAGDVPVKQNQTDIAENRTTAQSRLRRRSPNGFRAGAVDAGKTANADK